MTRLFALLPLLLAPAAALACEPDYAGRERVDRPLTLFSDGSFVDASNDDGWYDLSGRPARDIGGGRVGQVLQEWSCTTFESLLFVDCTTGSAILVRGVDQGVLPPELWDPEVTLSARALQSPYGPLALTASTTVAEVATVAARAGLTVEEDVPGFAAERGRRNAFNPFMGCEIFYPGSVGAGR